jgi:hypothetical protein
LYIYTLNQELKQNNTKLMALLVFFLLCTVPMVVGTASNSYANCLNVAAKFSTTVSNGPVANISSTTGVKVTCSELQNVSCPGSIINGVCTWQRKLCVTCINGSTVRIRVQSNGLPGRCASVPSTVAILETIIDFEVNFNPDVSVNAPYKTATTVTALNSIVCNISTETVVPSGSSYIGYSSDQSLYTLAGVAIDGMAILNVNSANQVDPFYPPSGYPKEGVDQCLSHPNQYGTYHYHISSGCMVSPPSGNISSCASNTACGSNIANFSLQSFPSSAKTLTVIGIGKDGHVIYGPYLSSGSQVTSGFDMCNGMFYDSIGNYGYFATTTYPYITGCFGPGNYPNVAPTCTTNGVTSYTMSSYALAFSKVTTTTTTTTTMRRRSRMLKKLWSG